MALRSCSTRRLSRALDDQVTRRRRGGCEREGRGTSEQQRRGGARPQTHARAGALLAVLERLDTELLSMAQAVESIRLLDGAATKTLAATVEPLQDGRAIKRNV